MNIFSNNQGKRKQSPSGRRSTQRTLHKRAYRTLYKNREKSQREKKSKVFTNNTSNGPLHIASKSTIRPLQEFKYRVENMQSKL